MSQYSEQQQPLTTRHEQGIHSLELRAGIERLRKKLGNKEQRSKLSEERTTTLTREPGSLQRTPTPISLEKIITAEESPRKKDRIPLSTRVLSSPDKLGSVEHGKWNDGVATESTHTRHLRTSSLQKESRREDTPRRTSSSPDANFFSLSTLKLSKNRSGNLSDSKVVESWTDEQQDFPTRNVSVYLELHILFMDYFSIRQVLPRARLTSG